MKTSEARKLKPGDVLATSLEPRWARRCVVQRIEALSPTRVTVILDDGSSMRHTFLEFVTPAVQAAWDAAEKTRKEQEAWRAEKARVAAFFGVTPHGKYNSMSYNAKEDDYSVILDRAQALALMEKYAPKDTAAGPF